LASNSADSRITIVIAALNEEEGIGPTLEELQKVLHNPCLLVVDGRSNDRTVEVAKNMGADVSLQEGKGKGDALFQGMQRLNSDVDYVVFTDADFTYPAEYVPKMVEILEQNPNIGMVTGNRFHSPLTFGSLESPFFLGNRFLAFTQRLLNGVDLRDPLTGLRVIRLEILKGWKPKAKGFDIEAEMNHLVERKGYATVEIPIEYRDRLGNKKLGMRHGFTIFRRIVMESFSH
jgi:glycosyltransferase involved in cell wall biosynthesis